MPATIFFLFCFRNEVNLLSILEQYRCVINHFENNHMTVSRKSMFKSVLLKIQCKTFQFQASPTISFVNEEGIDGGGLKREFFTYVFKKDSQTKKLVTINHVCLDLT